MRIATWNVNSLKARLEKVSWWLERAAPDVLLLQETKLADAAAPVPVFREQGYELAHHGEGRWNGVAIASRVGIADIVSNFGDPFASAPLDEQLPLLESREAGGSAAGSTPATHPGGPGGGTVPPQLKSSAGFTPALRDEARMVAARCGDVRVVSIYAPNGRVVESPFYEAKLAWYDRLSRWLEEAADPGEALVIGGDFNVAPDDTDVWDPRACHGGTHVSPKEREAFARLLRWGLVDAYRKQHDERGRYTWWDYRAGHFHKNFGMRIDHLLATRPAADRVVFAEIDREARKGKPVPSDHAPLLVDLDSPGRPIDAGWSSAEGRIASRRAKGA